MASSSSTPARLGSGTSSLENLVSELLESVGVLKGSKADVSITGSVSAEDTFQEQDSHDDSACGSVFRCMDQWLGIEIDSNDVDSMEVEMVEDCAPFSTEVYELISAIAIEAWNPTNIAPTTNVFIQEVYRMQERGVVQEEAILQQMSLKCLPAIRVTQWLRQWMEYNVEEPHEDDVRSFSQYLLLGPKDTPALPKYSEALLQALFIHMTLLPSYQSQLLLFNQAFQRGDFTGPKQPKQHKNLLSTSPKTTALDNPTQRLHHYQLAQQLSQRLTKEYNDHLEHVETILGDWYALAATNGSPDATSLRQLARAGLARIWMKFITQNASTSVYATTSLKGENTTASGLDVTLRVLHRILLGMPLIAGNDNNHNQKRVLEDLLFHQLLPLHQPHAMVLWRDQTSLLELYHEPLVQCMAHILKQYPEWIGQVCQALLLSSESIWPVGGNTPKQVLLLHEVDTYMGILMPKQKTTNDEDPRPVLVWEEPHFLPILSTIAQCMASEHSRLAERALTMLRNAYFKYMIYKQYYIASLRVLLPTLTRSSSQSNVVNANEKHAIPWNPTVRKMTFHVLKNLQQHNPTVFAKVCNQLFGDEATKEAPAAKEEVDPAKGTPKTALLANSSPPAASPSSILAFNQRFSLQAGMGDWRPPQSSRKTKYGASSSSGRHSNMPPPSARPPSGNRVPPQKQPPLEVTGIAPWAASTATKKNPPLTVTGVAPWANVQHQSSASPVATNRPPKQKNPPLTVKGVAPWANSGSLGNDSTGSAVSQKRPGGPPLVAGMPPKQVHRPPQPSEGASATSSASIAQSVESEGGKDQDSDVNAERDSNTTAAKNGSNPGLTHVLYYMKQCKPPGFDDNEDEHASSSWSKAQMSETPTLLPDLNFHDLVFGHELGHGAFGVVKYARLIDRARTRSQWPEYAVKIIATQKMKEMGYEYGVAREIACLHLISHPNVARLVSSFRFQQGAYLVLEYASGGDLHQLLQQHGSLDVPSCQFVMGETVSALASLHDDLGFVYADLKPENIVLSETGHVKLTDFGACRPYTDQAKAMLKTQMGKSGKNLLETLREGDPRKYNKQASSSQQHQQQPLCGIGEEEGEEEDEQSSSWMTTVDDSKQGDDDSHGVHTKVINDDTMQVVDSVEQEEKEDLRIEGTTAYLPPEVVLGSIPTPAADSWALGCVLYQCLSGRPPILEEDEVMTRSRIVTFEPSTAGDNSFSTHENEHDPLFGKEQKHAADIPDKAKALIRALLNRLPHQRPRMQQVAQHDFFDGQDVLRLYQKPAFPLDVGGVAPGPPDAQWSRRQFSSIWAPQPHAYDISGVTDVSAVNKGQSVLGSRSTPIAEGNEAGSPFSASLFYRTAMTSQTGNTQGCSKESNGMVQSTATAGTSDAANLTNQPLAPHTEEDDVSMESSEG